MSSHPKLPEGPVFLNVGGKEYTSTWKTLCRSPFFAEIVKDGSPIADKAAPLCVDADPEWFSVVLQRLRLAETLTPYELDDRFPHHGRIGDEFRYFGIVPVPPPFFSKYNLVNRMTVKRGVLYAFLFIFLFSIATAIGRVLFTWFVALIRVVVLGRV